MKGRLLGVWILLVVMACTGREGASVDIQVNDTPEASDVLGAQDQSRFSDHHETLDRVGDQTGTPDQPSPDICQPQCEGLECGDDGCGGFCGTCPGAAPDCVDGICQSPCVPDCEGKECGQDGCGGECGSCPLAAPLCVDGICAVECQPDCAGKNCGDDGCDGGCGDCPDGYKCLAGNCSADCDALCDDRECGTVGLADECDCGECPDTDLCVDALCSDEGTCLYSNNSAPCDDGNPCTGDDTCVEGSCTGTLLPMDQLAELSCVCSDDEDCEQVENGDVCDGTLYCDTDGDGGVCKLNPATVLDCDDSNVCTDDTCDPIDGCLYTPNDANECADSDACNGTETCVDGECVAGTPPDCDDNNLCTADICDPEMGCLNTLDKSVCDDDLYCTDDACEDGECTNQLAPYFCIIEGTCVPSGAEQEANPCFKCISNNNAADWTYLGDYATCGVGKVCHAEDCCDQAANCDGKDCGNDGCGGNCGLCAEGWFCKSGTCTEIECAPSCVDKECGPDGCGGSCGACAQNEFCTVQGDCICVPDCAGKQCGDNGCEGSCGTCPENFTCSEGLCQKDPCVPDCQDRECGSDGCDGSCGDCPAQNVCTEQGTCVCVPLCDGKECGGDGCGGQCGQCAMGYGCQDGECICQPQCDGLQCGEDGCGGSCGTCEDNEKCDAGTCVPLAGPNSCVGHCGDKAENCYCDDLCFLLGACCDDVCDACPDLENCTCGDDLCDPDVGEDCDTCPEDCGCDCGEDCQAGECIDVSCVDKECGDDGCEGSCGDCSEFDLPCASGSCADYACQVVVSAFYCVVQGSCVPSGTVNPDNECEKCNPNVDQLAWSPVSNGIGCGNGLACHDGICCDYDCDGKVCGDDGCGGTCGECEEGLVCCQGQCAECCDGNDDETDGCNDGAITEFLVNSEIASNNQFPAVATAPDGRFVVCWSQKGTVPGYGDVHCRFYGVDGQAIGYALQVSNTGYAIYPSVVRLADGWAVAWWGNGTDNNDDVFGRVLTDSGLPASDVFNLGVPTNYDERHPQLAPLNNGGFVAIWDKGNKWQLMETFDALGHTVVPEKAVGYNTRLGNVTSSSEAGFVASWKQGEVWYARAYTNDIAIDGATINLGDVSPGDLSPLSDNLFAFVHTPTNPTYSVADTNSLFVVSDLALPTMVQTYSEPATARLTDETFVTVWQGWNHIYFRRAGLNGTLGDQIQAGILPVKKKYSEVAGFDDGSFIVVWQSDWDGCQSCAIFAQRFDVNGQRIYH